MFSGLCTGGEGDPGAESEQSSLVLWSMGWRRVTQEQRVSSPLLFSGLWTRGGVPRSRECVVLSCSLVYGLEKGDQGAESEQSSLVLWSMDWRSGTQEQRVSSPLLFSGLWTGEEGYPGAECEQSSLFPWSMDWRRETQEQRVNSPLLFLGLWTEGGRSRSRD